MCREYKPLHSINKFAEQTKMTKKSIPSNHSPYNSEPSQTRWCEPFDFPTRIFPGRFVQSWVKITQG